MSTHTLTIDVPSVPYGPEHVPTVTADADYYRAAAKHIRRAAARGEAFAGSNLTETVAKLCDEVAEKLDAIAEPSAPEMLTRADFEMRWDAERTFPFIETEDATILAFGWGDDETLAAKIAEFDRLCAGEKYADEVDPTVPRDIHHTYAVVVEGKSGDDWRIKWSQSQDAPGAFPISVVTR